LLRTAKSLYRLNNFMFRLFRDFVPAASVASMLAGGEPQNGPGG
jgi:hypothetical protein